MAFLNKEPVIISLTINGFCFVKSLGFLWLDILNVTIFFVTMMMLKLITACVF